ncbi:MAG: indolepyruvate oxidoreductase subunit beta family protein, partial [Rhodospirillales bacterium]|nr:indolepyruvate oxidoreductase subunit beta family protein [Rhodospirillales bacterium]
VMAIQGAGYPAQSTSTPGVAQRTGATTYYLECFPEKNPPAQPIFALFPSSGDVDLVVALEPTEAGRALERGYVTGTTTVITAAERMYSTAEKTPSGDSTIKAAPVLEALDQASARLVSLSLKELAGRAPNQANAIMLGAIASAGILPITEEDCRWAVRDKGLAVEVNMAGFEIGLQAVRDDTPSPTEAEPTFNPCPTGLEDGLQDYNPSLRPLIGHALARMVDYQDEAYGRLYLSRLDPIRKLDSAELTRETAARLAAWMSYEDVIRVAQLKTRPGRFNRIRDELNLASATPLQVFDYFKPGRAEMTGILPPRLGWLVPRMGDGSAIRLNSASWVGFALLRVLAALKPLRRRGNQYRQEQAAIEGWLRAVTEAAGRRPELAKRTAALAVWARGYGRTRAGGLQRLAALFAEWRTRLEGDGDNLSVEVDQLLALAKANPELSGGLS